MVGWNGWRALRSRDDVELRWVDMPAGVDGAWWMEGHRSMVALGVHLGRIARHSVLTHELVHDERRIPTSNLPPAMAQKEEATVGRLAAERLLPDRELEELVDEVLEEHGFVNAALIAERAEVRICDAELRLEQLLTKHRNGHPSIRSAR